MSAPRFSSPISPPLFTPPTVKLLPMISSRRKKRPKAGEERKKARFTLPLFGENPNYYIPLFFTQKQRLETEKDGVAKMKGYHKTILR